jgi:biotin carboxylase
MAKRVGYQALGTIEFLFTRDSNYYFLEMNPRLQVSEIARRLSTCLNTYLLGRAPGDRGHYGHQSAR